MSESDPNFANLGGGALGGLDISALLAQAQALQSQLQDAQSRAAETIIEGNAGGGKVRIQMSGSGEFQSVFIDPSVVDQNEVDVLEDLVLAALKDGASQVASLSQQSMGGLASGLGGFGGLLG